MLLPVDHHVHLERGPYTLEWLDAFVNRARECGVSRLGIVEHSTQFRSLDWHMELEIAPATDSTAVAQREWFERHRNRESLEQYIEFIVPIWETEERGHRGV
jgi:histidinol-phosphatase (PHP family)